MPPSQQQMRVGVDRERRNAVGISEIRGEVEMAVTKWEPSFFGRQLTGSFNWYLCLDGLELVLTAEGCTHRVHAEEETAYRIQPGVFWTDITLFPGQGAEVKADGLPNTQCAALTHALNLLLAEKRIREDVAFLLGTLQTIEQWLEFKTSQEQHCHQARRWFTHEQQAAVMAARPSVDANAIRTRLKQPGVMDRLGPKANAVERSLIAWETDPYPTWTSDREKVDHADTGLETGDEPIHDLVWRTTRAVINRQLHRKIYNLTDSGWAYTMAS